jgi:YidC/Oxa1 family membrane protein insertase
MEKRVVLAVVLTIAVIYLTNVMFPPGPPPELAEPGATPDSVAGEPTAGTDTAVGGLGAETDPGARQEEVAGEQAGLAAAPALPEADTVVVRTDLYELRFSTVGASIVGARLLDYESYGPDANGDDRVRLVRPGDAVLGYRVAAAGDTADLSVRAFTASRPSLEVASGSAGDSLRFTYGFPGSAVRFVVTYGFRPGSYLVDVAGRLEGLGERGWSVVTSLGSGLPTNEKNAGDDLGQLAFVTNGQASGIESVQFDKLRPGEARTAEGGPFSWVAVKNKYFLIALVAPEAGPRFGGLIARAGAEAHVASLAASMPVPAGSEGFAFRAYLGPQKYERLEAVGQNLEGVNPYGWRWLRPIIRPLVGIVMLVLDWMHETLHLAYGWVLILFGVLMRVVLFPLYQKSMRAQLAQMQVQPLMKSIQEQHKDDPQRLQQEMMKLYREHNINPLAGCLPMLLPMPILFTLFFVFQGTIEFRGVPFFWLPDLSLKDPIYIIPLLMGASMFLLSWIGQRGMEQVNPQMKMMTYVLPVVFTVMFANFPSGLNLYYTTSNIASLPQQFYLAHERKSALAQRPSAPPQERQDVRRGGSRKRD